MEQRHLFPLLGPQLAQQHGNTHWIEGLTSKTVATCSNTIYRLHDTEDVQIVLIYILHETVLYQDLDVQIVHNFTRISHRIEHQGGIVSEMAQHSIAHIAKVKVADDQTLLLRKVASASEVALMFSAANEVSSFDLTQSCGLENNLFKSSK